MVSAPTPRNFDMVVCYVRDDGVAGASNPGSLVLLNRGYLLTLRNLGKMSLDFLPDNMEQPFRAGHRTHQARLIFGDRFVALSFFALTQIGGPMSQIEFAMRIWNRKPNCGGKCTFPS